ncbi:uncharacterized protein A1O9_02776 [Exophiala aquamarina CBS 119918]|uniref:Uncharacterized protein n=1 Tax=Exophiala aquamarina CBS 119918 TaxID=1182545 RepID=A0A072PMX0_9EURO|nr:uncharacterized protein A1O9_02776 [Exophiala aquamarina CBS 119918]KEF61211.1 hypothetical protein A1O9_02776 [Exophiala aquamarina CBS 119918]
MNDLVLSEAINDAARRKNETIVRIKQALKDRRLVIIVGAGVTLSATTDDNGRPPSRITWQGLIRNGLDYLVTENYVEASNRRTRRAYEALEDGDTDSLLDAAGILRDQLTRMGQFPTWLGSIFDSLYQEVRQPAILDVLHTLHQEGATLLTTNYDDLLERHCELRRIGRSNQDDVLRFKRGDIDGVFHIHGSYHDPGEVVLDTTDYYQVRQSNEVQSILKNFLEFKTILFVGCGSGLEDPNFDVLLQWVSAQQENIPNRHCLLVRDGDILNYRPLVRIKYGPDYGDLVPFLNQLSSTPAGLPRPRPDSAIQANERDETGFTVLDRAALKGNVEEIQAQWDLGADLDAIEPGRGYTPLIESIYQDKFDAFKALIAFGADVNKPNRDQHSPLHFCLNWRKDFRFGFTLLNEIAIEVDGTDKNGRTPLMLAALTNSPPFADLILNRGANVNGRDKNGMTAMHFAAMARSTKVMDRLLESEADMNSPNNMGLTPLRVALNSHADESLHWLLQHGADVGASFNAEDESGMTAMHFAAKAGSTELMGRLLEDGADINSKNNVGQTPLMLALDASDSRSINWLLENGAEVNAGRKQLNTAAGCEDYE